jgi:uncharacterized protein
MPIATLINGLAIIAGSILGIIFKNLLSDKLKKIIFQAMGLSTILIGIQMFFNVKNVLIVIISLVTGGIAGELLNLEANFEKFIVFIKSKSNSKLTSGKFSEGLITATCIFCIGSMAIVGSIDEGLRGNRTIILTKSILDGFLSIALASTYGVGVLFSFVFIILYQGSITLLAHFAQSFFTPLLIAQMTSCGGIMIVGIGLNILEIKKINVLNLLPGLAVVAILTMLFG